MPPSAAAAHQAKSSGSRSSWAAALWGWCNLSTVSCLVMGYYVYVTMSSLSTLMHPFDGVEVLPGAPTVKPLWPEGTPVSVLAYLSTNKAPSHAKAFNGTEPNLPVLWQLGSARDQLWYSESTAAQDRRVELIAPDAKGQAALAAAQARLATQKARLEEAGGSLLMMAANYLFEDDHSGAEAAAAAKGELFTVRGRKIWDKARQGQQARTHAPAGVSSCSSTLPGKSALLPNRLTLFVSCVPITRRCICTWWWPAAAARGARQRAGWPSAPTTRRPACKAPWSWSSSTRSYPSQGGVLLIPRLEIWTREGLNPDYGLVS
jgi:hypothetical protein